MKIVWASLITLVAVQAIEETTGLSNITTDKADASTLAATGTKRIVKTKSEVTAEDAATIVAVEEVSSTELAVEPQSIDMSMFNVDSPTIVAWNITNAFPYIGFVLPEGELNKCLVKLTDKALANYGPTDKVVEESNYLTSRFSFMKNENSNDNELGRTYILFRPLSCYSTTMRKPKTRYDPETGTITVSFDPAKQPIVIPDEGKHETVASLRGTVLLVANQSSELDDAFTSSNMERD